MQGLGRPREPRITPRSSTQQVRARRLCIRQCDLGKLAHAATCLAALPASASCPLQPGILYGSWEVPTANTSLPAGSPCIMFLPGQL